MAGYHVKNEEYIYYVYVTLYLSIFIYFKLNMFF